MSRVVLDTGVFFRPAVIAETLLTEEPVILPTVVVAERRRQLLRDARGLRELEASIYDSGYLIEPFDLGHAMGMRILEDDRAWSRNARDAMIAAHVRDGDVLWTTNPRDFFAIGLKPSQVRGV